jgi:hypothetical protein
VKPVAAISDSRCSGSATTRAGSSRASTTSSLAAIYDMTADEDRNRMLNVDGNAERVDPRQRAGSGIFHHVSSIAAAGKY